MTGGKHIVQIVTDERLISLPVGYVFGIVLPWGAPGILAGYGVGLVVASVLLVRRLWRVTDGRRLLTTSATR